MSRLIWTFSMVGIVILRHFDGITWTSQRSLQITDSVALLVATALLVSTVAVLVAYYRRIKSAGEKYEEAKGVVGDVVVSYNAQLRIQEEAIEKLGYKIEGVDARTENMMSRIDEIGKQDTGLPSKLAELTGKQDVFNKDLVAVKSELDKLRNMHESLEKQITSAPEVKIEAAIPIKRERALEPLTGTELRVLEFIASDGEKTAPEIRDMTELTREHSARLVKKLYEDGYLERDTAKTPFKYRVKDEMLKILKKSEANPQT